MRATANVNSRISPAFGLSLALGTATLMQLSARAQEEPKLPISTHIADQKNKAMGISPHRYSLALASSEA